MPDAKQPTSRAGIQHDAVAVAMLMALTFSTGVVDAVGYLGLDRVFTGNMTGNILILGMGVAGADGLPVVGPLAALIAFTLGSFVAGRILRSGDRGWSTRMTVLVSGGGVALGATAISMAASGQLSDAHKVAAAALTALVMGEQATVARALSVRDLTTVVVTSTLTSFASDSLTGRAGTTTFGRFWNRRSGAIALIFLGAVTGALLLNIHLALATSLAALITVAVAALGHHYLTVPRHPPTTTAVS